jgi:GNAT superfamily N-acetyltransferase
MKFDATIAIEAPPEAATLDELGEGLKHYNERFTGPWEAAEFVVTARERNEKFFGGVYCVSYGRTLFVKWMWLDGRVRKTGLGAKLLADAESEGRRRGATMAHLDTFSFQARGFYEKYGYRVFGTLEYPGTGIQRHYMSKLL